jgi:hypothetical protein
MAAGNEKDLRKSSRMRSQGANLDQQASTNIYICRAIRTYQAAGHGRKGHTIPKHLPRSRVSDALPICSAHLWSDRMVAGPCTRRTWRWGSFVGRRLGGSIGHIGNRSLSSLQVQLCFPMLQKYCLIGNSRTRWLVCLLDRLTLHKSNPETRSQSGRSGRLGTAWSVRNIDHPTTVAGISLSSTRRYLIFKQKAPRYVRQSAQHHHVHHQDKFVRAISGNFETAGASSRPHPRKSGQHQEYVGR